MRSKLGSQVKIAALQEWRKEGRVRIPASVNPKRSCELQTLRQANGKCGCNEFSVWHRTALNEVC
jgi:hypothetical protein